MMRSRDPVASQLHNYRLLLAVLLTALVLQSFGATGVFRYRMPHELIATLLFIAILLNVFARGRERNAMGVVVLLMLMARWAHDVLPARFDFAASVAYQALGGVFFWFAVWVVLRHLFRTPPIGAENVRGAICGYLIAGNAWAKVIILAYLFAPETYTVDPRVAALTDDWDGRNALFSYYSFAQMLTIGYADVTPARAPATTVSLLEALFGLFYTAVVVSQLVAIAQIRRSGTSRDR